MGHRSFAAARADALQSPITFDVDGEQFVVPRPVPVLPVLDLAGVAVSRNGQDVDEMEALAAFRETLAAILGPEQYRRFGRLRIGFRELLEIIQWLLEEATGRPTEPSNSSPSSSGTDGPSSTGAWPVPAPRH